MKIPQSKKKIPMVFHNNSAKGFTRPSRYMQQSGEMKKKPAAAGITM